MDNDQSHISTQTFGTIPYMPPELLADGRMTRAVDVYSFGIISAPPRRRCGRTPSPTVALPCLCALHCRMHWLWPPHSTGGCLMTAVRAVAVWQMYSGLSPYSGWALAQVCCPSGDLCVFADPSCAGG